MKLVLAQRLPANYSKDILSDLFRRVETQVNGLSEGALAARYQAASAAPTTGTYAKGDIVWNSAPTSGGFIGWVCVAAGTPGTWKTWGAIS